MIAATGTIGRYFGARFLGTVLLVFFGVFALVALVDYIELTRRSSGTAGASALLIAQTSLFRVPQVVERIMPFCILVGAMSCYLSLSRRLELVVARAAGMSAWQFVTPALVVAGVLGILASLVYNPVAAALQERSKQLELEMSGGRGQSGITSLGSGFWVRQKSADGQSIINAATSTDQGLRLGRVTAFTFDADGHFAERIEAKSAVLNPGFWRLYDAHVYANKVPPTAHDEYQLKTNLTTEQVRESFSTPETVPFWELPQYIEIAEHSGLSASGYRLQYQKLIAKPFLLAAMVLLAASVSLRFFRMGGVQTMVLSGVGAGFLLFVLSKVTDDLAKADLMSPLAAAWLPVAAGGLTGFIVMLHQEDG